ncbi:hereditary hemochromatosis protein homolog isoform X1 [Peromyscus leucopus]|uniref:hereditary hemochromatosis protein homolog isoform X1 n=2 Tax=Peromyscus leucopus TaxID=10041 RepID=UPI0010A17248|nr:hereditary hemochromatosis protein homolog isoform X1 [Peromyscus leucopus]XP_037057852.1 hereditary hemochromatosis protein homolog isoform X1 [Peromyscus leucopus]XP_037057856.1 hereditary hemochromatosis protein homolog isoform X1 [Peromyscus leucopus]
MKTMLSLEPRALVLVQLSLKCLLLEELLGTCAGTHTLHYDLMALSLEGTRKFEFRALGYIDNELFLRYGGERTRTELWGPRIKRQGGAKIWTRETEDMQEKEEQLRRMLTEVMTQKGQHGGIHTLQATFGCETQGNNTGGFWRLGYDGQDFLTFDQKSQMWKVSVPSTHSTKTFWERHGPSVDQVQTFLNDICPDRLQRYSIYLGNQLMDRGPPMVTVSRRPYPVGRITLTCWAFNLYTPVATLTWLQDGRPVQQHSFGPGTILPSGDGTFQTWVSIWVLPGQEPHFTCRLRHRSQNIEVPTLLGPQARESGGATSSASALVASAFPAMLVFLACA